MNILVINTGSSSIKYQLFDMKDEKPLVAGLAEKIGEKTGTLTQKKIEKDGNGDKTIIQGRIPDHREGLIQIVNLLTDKENGIIQDISDIAAVGHRVVHGGEAFKSSTIIDENVLNAVRKNIPLAPLHNPPNLIGIEVAMSLFPKAPQVAVFDTAFHQSIPEEAFLYALPYELYTRNRVRRYGFHGTSHAYVSGAAAKYLDRPVTELNLITAHLGNGASMAAVRKGKCVDTSMGLTPLEGLVMGTRSGDVDPALPFFLAQNLDMTLSDINDLLNKKSGVKGLCGTNDMREVEERAEAGDKQADTALKVYAHRIRKYIGAYFAVLGTVDALIFTAGIGENSPVIRGLSCSGLDELGICLDKEKNREKRPEIYEINTNGSRVKILVVPTNEEKRIARETKRVINNAL